MTRTFTAHKHKQLCVLPAHRVHLSEHCALSKEKRLPGVHQDQIKVGLPGPVGGTNLWWIQKKRPHKEKVTHKNIKHPFSTFQRAIKALIYLWAMGEVKQVGHDFL